MTDTLQTATLKDISIASGVAVSTVSEILRDSSRCWASLETKQRVKQVAREKGYRRNRIARGLVLQKTESLALIISDQRNPVYADLIHGVVIEAEKRDYEVFLCSAEESVKREKEYVDRLCERRCDGIILMPVEGVLDRKVISTLTKMAIPWITLGPPSPDIPGDYIYPDYRSGTYLVTQHLLHLGRRNFLFLAAGITANITEPWLKGYREALSDGAIPPDARAVRYCASDMRSAYNSVREAIQGEAPPDALVCLNDISAIAACRAIQDCGLTVPDDVSVVGSDDIEIISYIHKSLTTVRYGTQKIGEKAVRMLFERIKDPQRKPIIFRQKPQLIIRESCGSGPSA